MRLRFLFLFGLVVLVVGGALAYRASIAGWDVRLDKIAIPDFENIPHDRPSRISEIILQRFGCFGPCPVYTIRFKSNGATFYIGKRNVEKIGSYYGDFWDFPRLAAWIESQK